MHFHVSFKNDVKSTREKLKCARKPRMLYFSSIVGIRGIYLSLTLGAAKFKFDYHALMKRIY